MLSVLAASDPAAVVDLAVYGVAAFPMTLLLFAVRFQHQQLAKRDATIEKLNERLMMQSDVAIAQAERLAPLIHDASRVLTQALTELSPGFDRDRRR